MEAGRTWTVIRGEGELDAVLADFACRRKLQLERGRRDGEFELRRGSHTGTRARGARRAHEEELPLRGTLRLAEDREQRLTLTATLTPDAMGVLFGRGPLPGGVRRRYQQLFGELLADLGESLGARPT